MSKGRLCIDIDNVVAQTDEVMRKVICEITDGRVNLEYEQIVEFDYHKCSDSNNCAITKDEWRAIHNKFSEPRYLWLVQPVDGVQVYLKRLSRNFYINFATSRLPSARRTTVEWLENHGFPPHDLHFLKHGEKHKSLGKFTAAVEDHYEQAIGFANAGTPCYLIEHPWNKGKLLPPNIYRVNNWGKLTERLVHFEIDKQ